MTASRWTRTRTLCPNCTEISCSEINLKLVFNPGHEDADGDGDGDESHKEPESDYMLYISSVTSNWSGQFSGDVAAH